MSLVRICEECEGKGEIDAGMHNFPRFGVLAMSSDCPRCGGKGKIIPKYILRKGGAKRKVKPISENVNHVLEVSLLGLNNAV